MYGPAGGLRCPPAEGGRAPPLLGGGHTLIGGVKKAKEYVLTMTILSI